MSINQRIKSNIYIDDRWQGNFGIGAVTKNLYRALNPKPLRIPCDKLSLLNLIIFTYKIFNLPHNSIVINPGFNSPLYNFKNYYFFIHDLVHIDFYRTIYNKFYYLFFIKFIYKKSNRIITDSNFSKERIVNLLNFNSDNINVIYCAIDNNFFTNKILRNKYKFDYIFSVTNEKLHKNNKMLLKSFALLSAKNKVKLIIVGTLSSDDRRLIYKLKLVSDVIILKNVTTLELVSLYRNCKAFVCASFYEGFSLPVAEAMASKVPILVSDIPVHHEITNNSVVFFDPYDPKNLKKLLLKVLKSYNAKMIKNAYNFSLNFKFSLFERKIKELLFNK